MLHYGKPKNEIFSPLHLTPPSAEAEHDDRFQKLVGEREWNRLPKLVQKRFSKSLRGGKIVYYRGHNSQLHRNIWGKLLAQALRVIGAPLPIFKSVNLPTVVSVCEDSESQGQVWSRHYQRENAAPQVIQSVKKFSGETGLEEYIGFGLSIALNAEVSENTLEFHSHGINLDIGRFRMGLPKFLEPGRLVVKHHDLGGGDFEFSLSLKHKIFGTLLYQSAIYHDSPQTEAGRA